jgi:16S rRNA C967 or C1407 C5-methylase (RsmB/RsmF family)
VVESFLGRHAEAGLHQGGARDWPGPLDAWTPEGFLRLSPHRHEMDGFFAALFRKGG